MRRFADNANDAAVRLDDVLDDRETESCSADVARTVL
jgi:hypothetical protein